MSKISYPPATAGGGAPDTVQYLVLALDAGLSAERRLMLGEGLSVSDGGANADYSVSVASRVVDRSATSVDVTVSTTVTIYSYVIPSNQLGTNKAIRYTILGDLLNSTATTQSVSLFIALGATTMYSGGNGIILASASRRAFNFELILASENANNAQVLGGLLMVGTAGGATTGLGDFGTDEILALTPIIGTAAETSTASLTFMVAVKMSSAGASSSFRKRIAFAELL